MPNLCLEPERLERRLHLRFDALDEGGGGGGGLAFGRHCDPAGELALEIAGIEIALGTRDGGFAAHAAFAPWDGAWTWQAAMPAAVGTSGGIESGQIRMASGQRGWNGQPGGGFSGSGKARPRPVSGMPRPGSGVSTDWSSARV